MQAWINDALVELTVPTELAERASCLPDDPSKYFTSEAGAILLSMEDLLQSRVRLDGVARAIDFMAAAYEGRVPRRPPILVKPLGLGKYVVIDGNSTATVARAAGWSKVFCKMIAEGARPDDASM